MWLHLALNEAVVFLNKFDLLEQKLRNGVKVNKYLPSFGDRENTAPVLARCMLFLLLSANESALIDVCL